MSARLTIDSTMFSGVFKNYLNASKRTLAEGINAKSYFIIKKAIRLTRVANKKEMRSWVRSSEGQNWIGSLFGRKLIKYENRKAATKKIISARVRSMGYLRAGWAKAYRVFGKATKSSRRYKGVMIKGKPKGDATAAREGLSPSATFSNATGYRTSKRYSYQKHSQSDALKKFGQPAFERAIKNEMRSIARYLEKKMQKTANKSRVGK